MPLLKIYEHTRIISVVSADKDPVYKELPVIRNLFSFPNLKQGTTGSSLYGYTEHIFVVSISFS